MKANEFLKLVNGNLKLELPEDVLTKLDADLPEGFDTKFTETYLTRDRAKNDDEIIQEITKKSNKNALSAIDEQIKEILPYLTAEEQQKINSTFSTVEKMKIIKPGLDDAFKRTKGKAASDDIAKVEKEWSEKIAGLKLTHAEEIKKLAAENERKNFEGTVINKLSGYTFAKQFNPLRENLNQMAILALTQKGYKYQMENGKMVVKEEKDDILRDIYKGEKKMEFEDLLDEFAQPFVAKSNGDDNQDKDKDKKIITPITGTEDLMTLMRKQAGQA